MNMQSSFCLFVLSTVAGWAASQDMSFRAVVGIASGEPQVFVGETVTLRCSIPGNLPDPWRYLWFKDGAPIRQYKSLDDTYTLTALLPMQSGNYSCEGTMITDYGSLLSVPSQPLRIDVEVGRVVLQAPPQPLLIDDSATLTCRVRRNPFLTEVVFYKDGTELQRGSHPKLHLHDLKLQDQGAYWCRATWGHMSTWKSSQSVAVQISVIDGLTVPVIEVLNDGPVLLGHPLVLRCRVQINIPRPGLRLRYYFLRNGQRLGLATSRDTLTIPQATLQHSGQYQCKVAVQGLSLTKLSNSLPVEVVAVSESSTELF
ncbi:Fc receptor-like A [Megalops cyprinoides]|uniref:Fc receptor-like A n=1 Tax=Megalops cyprinoides TaxID=118141 RepID=UPI001864AA41|nr:Fc receptor-like A [Megalops cyprinoides]